MNFIYKSALLALAAGITFTACKKDDDEKKDTTPSVAKLTGTWHITAGTATPTAGTNRNTQNVYDSLPACVKDNRQVFTANGKYYTLEGASKCTTTSPDTNSKGTYTLSGNTLTTTEGSESTSVTIKEMTSTSMIAEFNDSVFVDTLYVPATFRTTFAK